MFKLANIVNKSHNYEDTTRLSMEVACLGNVPCMHNLMCYYQMNMISKDNLVIILWDHQATSDEMKIDKGKYVK